MSSFARRSLRVSAAAAGIAALGLGIAGPAFAAPSVPALPELPSADAVSSPDVTGIDSFSAATDSIAPAAGSLSDLPDAFQMPEVPSLSDASAFDPTSLNASAPSDAAPTDALPDGIVTTHGGLDQLAAPSPSDAASIFGTNDIGGVPSADALSGLADQAAAGDSITSHQDFGSTAGDDDDN